MSLRGSSIPTDGSGRIVITDINPDGENDVDALICLSELSLSARGDWFLHPTQQTTQLTTDGSIRIASHDVRGWRRNRDTVIDDRRLVRLRRDDSIASGGRALEGVFTCDIAGDRNTPVPVGIYYPSECVKLIIVENHNQLMCTHIHVQIGIKHNYSIMAGIVVMHCQGYYNNYYYHCDSFFCSLLQCLLQYSVLR